MNIFILEYEYIHFPKREGQFCFPFFLMAQLQKWPKPPAILVSQWGEKRDLIRNGAHDFPGCKHPYFLRRTLWRILPKSWHRGVLSQFTCPLNAESMEIPLCDLSLPPVLHIPSLGGPAQTQCCMYTKHLESSVWKLNTLHIPPGWDL